MNIQAQGRLAVLIILLALALPAFAHHGNAAFESSKRVTIKGTVVGWLWANPHCVLTFDAKDDKGNVVHWSAEANIPSDMAKRGWARNSFKPGDPVSVTLAPAKNGVPVGRIDQVELANGQILTTGIPPDSPTETKP